MPSITGNTSPPTRVSTPTLKPCYACDEHPPRCLGTCHRFQWDAGHNFGASPRGVPPAIVANAAVVVIRNHPSSDPTPSEADIKVTGDLIRAGQLLKIELLDHVIKIRCFVTTASRTWSVRFTLSATFSTRFMRTAARRRCTISTRQLLQSIQQKMFRINVRFLL